ncbi:MAG: ABC transporter permease [Thermoanaerobaculales bacterium]|jgi:lipopolysaccharide transport system permease protein|nr:ABC transporter permease [Thermoanaerobaculales bacterium]
MTRHALALVRLPGTLLRHRFLLRQLAWRAFAARHAGSYLGWLWTPVATAVQFALYMVVFAAILQIKVEGLGIDVARRPAVGFGVFLITGLVPFVALADVLQRATRVFRAHASLVQRVRMPAEVLVLGDVAGTLLHHAISFALVLAYCGWRGHLALAGLPWVATGIALLLLWILGLALCASLLGAFLPDIAEVVGLALQVLFYAAPIVYPLALVREPMVRAVIEANPITPLLGILRAGLVGAAPPPAAAILLLLAGGALALAAGAAALSRWRGSIPDLV